MKKLVLISLLIFFGSNSKAQETALSDIEIAILISKLEYLSKHRDLYIQGQGIEKYLNALTTIQNSLLSVTQKKFFETVPNESILGVTEEKELSDNSYKMLLKTTSDGAVNQCKKKNLKDCSISFCSSPQLLKARETGVVQVGVLHGEPDYKEVEHQWSMKCTAIGSGVRELAVSEQMAIRLKASVVNFQIGVINEK